MRKQRGFRMAGANAGRRWSVHSVYALYKMQSHL